MKVYQGITYLYSVVCCSLQRQLSALLQYMFKCLSFYIFHDEIRFLILIYNVNDLNQVLIVKPAPQPRLLSLPPGNLLYRPCLICADINCKPYTSFTSLSKWFQDLILFIQQVTSSNLTTSRLYAVSLCRRDMSPSFHALNLFWANSFLRLPRQRIPRLFYKPKSEFLSGIIMICNR